MSNSKKILSVLIALIMALSVFTSVPLSASAAVYTPPEGFTPESNKIYFDTAGSGWDMHSSNTKVAFYISGGDFETDANPTVPLEWGSRDLIGSRVEGTDSIFEFDPAAVNYTFTPGAVYHIVFVTAFKRAWSFTEVTAELDFTVDRLGHVGSCSGRKEDTNAYEVHWDDEEYTPFEPTEPEPEPYSFEYKPYGYYHIYSGGGYFDNIGYVETDPTRLVVCGYNGNAKDIVIPETHDGLPVVAIDRIAFSNNTNLKSVTIPDSVVEIWDKAFYDCTNLTDVTFPETLAEMVFENRVFEKTAWYNNLPDGVVYYGNKAVGYKGECPETLEIRPGTVSVSGINSHYLDELSDPDYQGDNLRNLKKLILPEGLQSIKGFEDCQYLSEVTIPDSVTSIGDYAFSGCSYDLKKIVLPDSVTSIGYRAFSETRLEDVTISDAQFEEILQTAAFTDTPWWNTIPDGVQYIGKEAVGYKGECPKTLEFRPGTVSVRGINNVEYVNSLADIHTIIFPKGLQSVSGFYACNNLRTVIFPEGLQSIAGFNGCFDLQSVTIPASVTEFSVNFGNQVKWQRDLNRRRFCSENVPFDVTVYGYAGSAAERISELNDEQQPCGNFTFVPLAEKTAENGVKANLPENQELNVTDSEKFDQSLLPEDAQLLKAYDLNTMQDGEAVYSEQVVTVKIPCRYPDAKVYYQDETYGNLSLIDMNAEYKDGYLIFKTAKTYRSTYVVATGADVELAVCGDADGDGEVTTLDVTIIQRYCASSPIKIDPAVLMNADVDGDGEVDIIDATYIQRYLAKMEIPYSIGEKL